MGNKTGKPRGFSDTISMYSKSPPSSKNNSQSTSANNAKHIATNDFVENMINDMAGGKAPHNIDQTNYILRKKICAYNTNEFDDAFDQISNEIDRQYTDYTDEKHQKEQTKTKTKTKISNKKTTEHDEENKPLYVKHIANIKSIFRYNKQLGKGGTCRVVLVQKRQNRNEKYALKELSKTDKFNEALFAKEIQLLKLLKNNINVLDFYAAYQTTNNYYIATSYCSGGTFLDRILAMKSFSERSAIKYIYIILSAVQYMHSMDIVHRDLKLNNMVFDHKGNDAILKIIDFGDGEIVAENDSYKELVGTLYYLSPECKLWRKGWEIKKSDMWSIGVICYVLLSGKLPFSGKSQAETIKLIQKAKFKWPDNVELSDSCKSFIKSLLQKSTKKRLSASEALKHEWISDYEEKANDINLLDKIRIYLKDFNYNNKLHMILVNACLEEIDVNEVKVIVNGFHNIDIDNKGNINESDICKYLMLNSNINKYDNNNASNHAKHIFNVIGNNTKIKITKSIPIQEFVEDISSGMDDEYKEDKKSYNFIDEESDEDDNIAVSTFKNIMHKSPKKYPVDNIINELDPYGSGFISFKSISKFKKNIKTLSFEGMDHENYE